MKTDTRASRSRSGKPPRAVNRAVLGLLHSPLHVLLDPGICELRFVGRRSGRAVALPVIYAEYGDRLVVLVGDSADKRWWRNFTQPYPVEVRRGSRRRAGTGRIVAATDPGYGPAWHAYAQRQHLATEPGDRLLVIDFAGPGG